MSVDTILREFRYASRLLVRTPGTSVLVLIVLGLALAGNITLSIVDTTLFKPQRLAHRDRMINIYTVRRDLGHGGLSYPDYVDLAASLETAGACEEVFGYSGLMATVSAGDGPPEMVFGEIVTANYFSASGAPLLLGSGFLADDDRSGQPARLVIGHRYWQRRFGGDPNVVNRTIRLNGLPFTIAGVAAPSFAGLLFSGLAADVWVPIAQLERVRGNIRHDRGERWLFVRARLSPGATIDDARVVSEVTAAQLAASYPDSNRDRSFRMLRTSDVLVNPEADVAIRPIAGSLIVLGMLVLSIAGANVASVLMARLTMRRRELALRVAIGGTRGQVMRLLAAEATILAVASLAGGALITGVVLRALAMWQPSPPVPLGWTFAIDLRVAVFAVVATVLIVVLTALLPAWRVTRQDPLAVIRGPAQRSTRFPWGRESLLVPQIASSLILLVAAGLLVRSLQRAASIDPGFSASNATVMALNLGLTGYDETRARQFWDALLERLRSDTTIVDAAITDRIPLDLYGSQSAAVSVDRYAARTMQVARVGERYFEVLDIPILAGRDFDALDRGTSSGGRPPAAAIVSASAARELWHEQNALGQRVRVGENGDWRTVVGIVGDVQLVETLGENGAPLIYVPLTDGYTRLMRVAALARPDQRDLQQKLTDAARAIDADVAIFEIRALAEHLETMLLPFRAAAATALAAGTFGLLLTLLGVAGSVTQAVVGRTREIAIRMALGGQRRAVVLAILRPAARAALLGLGAGWLGSLGAAQAIGSVLFGVGPFDPLTLMLVPMLVVAALTAAAIAPLRRALGANPAAALRDE